MGLSSDEGLHVEVDDKSQLSDSSSGHNPHSPSVWEKGGRIERLGKKAKQMKNDKWQDS